MMFCKKCGQEISDNAKFCTNCGTPVAETVTAEKSTTSSSNNVSNMQPQVVVYTQPTMGIDPSWPLKNKIVAALLAIFLGGIGIHKFYLNKTGQGLAYALLFWTFLPAIIGFFEGIAYLCSSDESFQQNNKVCLQ